MTEAPAGNERSSNLHLPAILLIAAVFAWIAPTLRWLEFSNGAENLNVATALEMRRGGPWLVPNLQGEPRTAKPPLAAWITAAFIRPQTVERLSSTDASIRDRAFRDLAWQARLPGLVSMCLLLLAVYGLASAIGDDTLGVVSVAICATTLMFLRYARYTTTDTQLALWVVAANWLLAEAFLRKRWWLGFVGGGIALGLAMMSKGPVSLLQTVLPVALFGIWRKVSERAATVRKPAGRSDRRFMLAGAVGLECFLAVALPWFAYVLVKHDVIQRWMQEVTRVGAREDASDPWFIYLSILGYVTPWIVFFIVGFVVIAQQMRRRVAPAEALPLFLLVVPIVVMAFFRDRQERYLLPMIAPAAVIAARGVVEHFRSWARWNLADTLVTSLHWLIVLGIAVGVPIAGATSLLKRADGLPWYPWNFAIPCALTAVAVIALGVYLHRSWRGALVLVTFVTMLFLQAIFVLGYASSAGGRSEMRPLAESIAQLYPDAEVYNAHPRGKRPPTDLGVYLNRVLKWVPDPSAIPPSHRPQIVLYRQNQHDPKPRPPAGWDLLDVKPRDKDFWYAFIRDGKTE